MSLNPSFISSEFNLNVVSNSDRRIYLFEEYRLDKASRMLCRRGEEILLTPKAIETLLALVERRGEIVGKDDLMDAIWKDAIVEESNLYHHLHSLRRTLGKRTDGTPFIETLKKRGYRFTADVRVIEAPNSNGKHAERENPEHSRSANQTNESLNSLVEPQTVLHAKTSNTSLFSPMLGAIAVLTGLLASTAIWYFQRQPIPAQGSALAQNEMSVTNLTNGRAVSDATISRDGKYIVYHEVADNSERMWLQQTRQQGRIELIPPAEHWIGPKTFSPTGEFVYFIGRETDGSRYSLFRIPTLGGPVTKILADINSPVSFSPDGRLMSFVRQSEKTKEYRLITADPDGADERVLVTRVGSDAMSGNTAWSPDGKYLAYQSMDLRSVNNGPCSIAAINVETLDSKALSAERWDNCYRMAWTNDGRGLVFIGTRSGESLTTRRDQIYYVSVADGISRRISTDGNRHMAGSFGLTADGELLVVPHKRFSQIWVMNSDGNSASAEQLTNGQRDGTAGIAPLPDGRVGYVSRVGENLTIWIMNADGSNQQQIGSQIAFLEELRATPDGRFFIFSGQRDGFSHLYRIDTDGQNLVQLTDGKSYEIDSAISPDSHWVYYDSTDISGPEWKASLRKTSVDNSQTIELRPLETTGIVPDISPDGKLILGLTRGGGLTTFSTADGSQLNHFRTDKFAELGPGAKWTRDGQFFTYLVNRKDSMNIWVQPLHGPQARPLTHFPKGYIYSYAFSRDGTKLYIARGYQTLDAVLIRNF